MTQDMLERMEDNKGLALFCFIRGSTFPRRPTLSQAPELACPPVHPTDTRGPALPTPAASQAVWPRSPRRFGRPSGSFRVVLWVCLSSDILFIQPFYPFRGRKLTFSFLFFPFYLLCFITTADKNENSESGEKRRLTPGEEGGLGGRPWRVQSGLRSLPRPRSCPGPGRRVGPWGRSAAGGRAPRTVREDGEPRLCPEHPGGAAARAGLFRMLPWGLPGPPPPRTLPGRPLLGLESPKGGPRACSRCPAGDLLEMPPGALPTACRVRHREGGQPAGALLRAPSTRQVEREWGWAWGSPSGAGAPVCPVRGWDGSVGLIPSTGVPVQAGPVGIFPLPLRGALTSAPAARTARLSRQGPRICHGICPPPASLRGLKARRRG